MTTIDGPLGATWTGEGTHFRVFSSVAERVELCLFDQAGAQSCVDMKAEPGCLWHVYRPDAGPGQAYGFRVHGPYDPARGLRCDPSKVLTDPYAKAISAEIRWGQPMFAYPLGGDDMARDESDSAAHAPRSFVIDPAFDWGDDVRPRQPLERTVLYELHVKGFTRRHPGVPEALRGTFAGLATPAAIEAITSLGVTAVELMPIQHFVHEPHLLDQGLRNYWGYHTLGFFAPHAEYAATGDRGEQVNEFKSMVRALHAAGLEVIIDVVYNHTAEGNHLGPTLSFKGFDNPAYYHLVADDPRHYMDYTGTGNSVNLRHPGVLQLVMDSLRYWVREMHVDGFRFDLAATLARGPHNLDTWSAFFATIHQDPVLQKVKLIAEPWDTGHNGYQVGNFPFHWSEWNDKYRETVRGFWREPSATPLSELPRRVTGSADLFQAPGRGPSASINYIASHDGQTVRDLADSSPALAGMAPSPERDQARLRLQRNLLATLLLSMGTPMLNAGDEWGRSQQGQHNPYDQDNEISWLDWSAVDEGLREFTRRLIDLRPFVPWLERDLWPNGWLQLHWRKPDGIDMTDEDWSQPRQHIAVHGLTDAAEGMLLLNGGDADQAYDLPPLTGAVWRLACHTACPNVACTQTVATPFTVPARSVSLLVRTTEASA